MRREITDDLDALFDILPPHIREPLYQQHDRSELIKVVLDLGRLRSSLPPPGTNR